MTQPTTTTTSTTTSLAQYVHEQKGKTFVELEHGMICAIAQQVFKISINRTQGLNGVISFSSTCKFVRSTIQWIIISIKQMDFTADVKLLKREGNSIFFVSRQSIITRFSLPTGKTSLELDHWKRTNLALEITNQIQVLHTLHSEGKTIVVYSNRRKNVEHFFITIRENTENGKDSTIHLEGNWAGGVLAEGAFYYFYKQKDLLQMGKVVVNDGEDYRKVFELTEGKLHIHNLGAECSIPAKDVSFIFYVNQNLYVLPQDEGKGCIYELTRSASRMQTVYRLNIALERVIARDCPICINEHWLVLRSNKGYEIYNRKFEHKYPVPKDPETPRALFIKNKSISSHCVLDGNFLIDQSGIYDLTIYQEQNPLKFKRSEELQSAYQSTLSFTNLDDTSFCEEMLVKLKISEQKIELIKQVQWYRSVPEAKYLISFIGDPSNYDPQYPYLYNKQANCLMPNKEHQNQKMAGVIKEKKRVREIWLKQQTEGAKEKTIKEKISEVVETEQKVILEEIDNEEYLIFNSKKCLILSSNYQYNFVFINEDGISVRENISTKDKISDEKIELILSSVDPKTISFCEEVGEFLTPEKKENGENILIKETKWYRRGDFDTKLKLKESEEKVVIQPVKPTVSVIKKEELAVVEGQQCTVAKVVAIAGAILFVASLVTVATMYGLNGRVHFIINGYTLENMASITLRAVTIPTLLICLGGTFFHFKESCKSKEIEAPYLS